MLAVGHRPELVTSALLAWLRPHVRYDEQGRCQARLADAVLPGLLADVARAVCPDVPPDGWSEVNLQGYRDGRAATSCHTDVGATGLCLVLSLGATRTLRIHRVPDGTRAQDGCGDRDLDARLVPLVQGATVVMSAAFQAGWHHQIVAEPDVMQERLSVVFRTRPKGF